MKAVCSTLLNRVDGILQYQSAGGTLARIVQDDESTVLRRVNFFVDPGQTLLSLAATRPGCEQALIYLTTQDADSTATAALERRLPLSCLVEDESRAENNLTEDSGGEGVALVVENVRLEILTTSEVRSDGLVSFWTGIGAPPPLPSNKQSTEPCDAEAVSSPDHDEASSSYIGRRTSCIGKSFSLPHQVEEHKDRVLALYAEQSSMIEDIEKATQFLPLVPGCCNLVALYTTADLNCLLHAAFISMVGVGDGLLASEDPNASTALTRTVLRNAVHDSLHQCEELMRVASEGSTQRLQEIQRDIAQGKASLDGGHIFALANVLRRPIVVYAHAGLEGGENRPILSVPFRVSGVYLPLLWQPQDTIPDPIVMCYSRGHFSALVAFTTSNGSSLQNPLVRVPLCDEMLCPLPVPFFDHYYRATSPMSPATRALSHSRRELEVLHAYLREVETVSVGDGEKDHTVTTVRQVTNVEGATPNDEAATPPSWTDRYRAVIWERLIRRSTAAEESKKGTLN